MSLLAQMPWYAWLWCIAMAGFIGGIVWCCWDTNRILKKMERYR